MTLHGLHHVWTEAIDIGRSGPVNGFRRKCYSRGLAAPQGFGAAEVVGSHAMWPAGNVLPQACGLEQADACTAVGDPFDHRRTHA
jgi:hypothetical protein